MGSQSQTNRERHTPVFLECVKGRTSQSGSILKVARVALGAMDEMNKTPAPGGETDLFMSGTSKSRDGDGDVSPPHTARLTLSPVAHFPRSKTAGDPAPVPAPLSGQGSAAASADNLASMTLEPSVSTEEFAPEFPAQETFAPEFPSENAETMMMGAPEPAPAAPAADQPDQGDMMGDMMGGMPAQEPQGDMMGGMPAQDLQGDMMGGMPAQDPQGDMMGGMQAQDASDFGGDFGEPQQQTTDSEFFAEPLGEPAPPAPPAIDDSALREWKARQETAIQEKRVAEERELKHIHEEAQAERELLYSQREKQIAAAKKANREREVVMEASRGEGWEAVLNLISDENLVKDKNTDLGRFKQILTRLKHQKPLATM